MRSFLSSFFGKAKAEPSCWERYAPHIKIHPDALIAPSATVTIVEPPETGEICLEIGAGSQIFCHFALLRPRSRIVIGERCQLGHSHFTCADSIFVGDDVIMSWGVNVIDSDNHASRWEDRQHDVAQCRANYDEYGSICGPKLLWDGVPTAPVSLGDRSLIGLNAIILKGVSVGDEAVVGAGSVVSGSIPARHVAAGNPCRVIRKLG